MIKINHTQISNDYLDFWMSKLPPVATIIFLAISRKTIGWHKDTDIISYSQLKEMTGIKSTNTLKAGIKELVDNKIIVIVTTGRGKSIKKNYEINYDIVSNIDTIPNISNFNISNIDTKSDVIVSNSDTKDGVIVSNIDTTKDINKDINKEILRESSDSRVATEIVTPKKQNEKKIFRGYEWDELTEMYCFYLHNYFNNSEVYWKANVRALKNMLDFCYFLDSSQDTALIISRILYILSKNEHLQKTCRLPVPSVAMAYSNQVSDSYLDYYDHAKPIEMYNAYLKFRGI